MKVPIDKNDLSIAHRLPSRLDDKPIKARFTSRTVKIEMLRNKRSLVRSNQFQNEKIYEDLSKVRLNFVRLLKRDVRVNTTYIREGTIYYSVNGLYEGGVDLGYKLEDVYYCFETNNQTRITQNVSHFDTNREQLNFSAGDRNNQWRPIIFFWRL